MAFPANPNAHPFIPRSGSFPRSPVSPVYPQTFQNPSNPGDPALACQQCLDYSIAIPSLQTRIAVLDMQLSKMQKDNADAEMTIRYLLGLNANAKNEPYALYSARQVASELRHKLKQETTEKDSIKVILESALNKIVHLHRARELESSGPSLSPDSTLCDNDISSVAGFDDGNEAEKTETPEKEDRSYGVEASPQDFSKLEYETASASSYMFHFVNESSDEDRIIMMKENVSKASASHGVGCKHIFIPINAPGSEGGLTAVNPASMDLFDVDSGRIVSPSPGSAAQPTMTAAPQGSSMGNGDPIHNYGLKSHGLGSFAPSGKIEYPIQLHESEANLREFVDFQHRRAGLQDRKFPDLYKDLYGVQFNPGHGAKDVFRTIVISNLPQVATMTALLDQVREGVIFDAKLLDTSTITGGKTALITFCHQRNAETFEANAKSHPITIQNQSAQVTLLKTATWPSPLSQRVMLEGNRTRCLEVTEYPRHVTCSDLRRKLRVCSVMKVDRIEHVALRYDGVLSLRFDSIAHAWKAQGMFASNQEFRGCVVRFAPDPCAQPLQSRTVKGPGEAGYASVYQKTVPQPVTVEEIACYD